MCLHQKQKNYNELNVLIVLQNTFAAIELGYG